MAYPALVSGLKFPNNGFTHQTSATVVGAPSFALAEAIDESSSEATIILRCLGILRGTSTGNSKCSGI